MLRATHLPPVASPTFFALRQSLVPTLIVSFYPCYSLRKLSAFSPFRSFFSNPLTSGRPFLPSPTLSKVSPMVGHPRLTATASFNSDSSSGDDREILVQHLLLKEDDQKLLLELQQRIAGGEDLSDLAVEYSICPSKQDGGMLGWVRKGQMVPEFEQAAFSAPLNKVVKCKTNFGWHLLQVLSEREESVLKDIQPEEFHAKMQDPSFIEDAQLIDVREPDEVSIASLPGFEVLPLRQFGSWGPEITSKFDPMKDTYVMGFRKIYNLSGGIHAYATKVDPSVPTY
ncbi:Peptidyl-prolyl cis-trans isomerase, PpiC-type [Corchorus capsularis]|uniref:Peptidyl-prolyl cis-trans isomerase n=1 Tax=Corchorus capsularis TaxID=210143 RepID=A0A1R3IX54_COCAP|nr:Peptidyl-prolyl cis-trans isomerase, PpiC-type [Corchorus capsularis]